jgi:hypothetical protein
MPAMRRFVGSLVLVTLFASPTVARARMVCRYTGVEITDCDEHCPANLPVVRDAGCCDERIVQPLPVSRVTDQSVSVAPAVALAPLVRDDRAVVHVSKAPSHSAAPDRPPLYVVQRALLI